MRSITYEIWNLQKIAEANRTQIELIERMIRIFSPQREQRRQREQGRYVDLAF